MQVGVGRQPSKCTTLIGTGRGGGEGIAPRPLRAAENWHRTETDSRPKPGTVKPETKKTIKYRGTSADDGALPRNTAGTKTRSRCGRK